MNNGLSEEQIRLNTVQELNALKLLIDESDSFREFFNNNFEYINIKKKFLNGWVGFNYKKTHPDIFDLNIQNLIRMYYIDIKYCDGFYLAD